MNHIANQAENRAATLVAGAECVCVWTDVQISPPNFGLGANSARA